MCSTFNKSEQWHNQIIKPEKGRITIEDESISDRWFVVLSELEKQIRITMPEKAHGHRKRGFHEK
jgi:hypothetical protein